MESSIDGRLDESRWSVLYDSNGEGEPDVYYETKAKLNPESRKRNNFTSPLQYSF